MVGQVLNERYKLEEKIGEGGMAIVFRGQDQLLGRKVAVKVLRPQFVSDSDFVRRFQREAKAAASLNHPNIVNVFDIGQDGDLHYLVMENVEGINLKQRIKKEGAIPLVESLDIASEIAQALAVAHKNNIVHCDIKPHNILLTEDNGCKVTDFGIARAVSAATMTYTDSLIGSAPYVSPEQAKGERLTSASDQYSLGIVLYELLTGRLPFKGDSPISLALKHIREEPAPPSSYNPELPSFVEEIIMTALAKDPEKRYQNVEKLNRAIINARDLYLEEQEETKEISPEVSSVDDGFPTQELPHVGEFLENSRWKTESIEERNENFDDLPEEEKKSSKQNGLVNLLKILQPYRYLILTGLIIILVLGGSFGFYRWYMNVPVVEVPELVGKSEEEVIKKLNSLELEFVIGGDQPHNEIPEGHVVTHIPAPGTKIRASREVRLILSSGPMWAEVPDLLGGTLRETEIILGAASLTLGEVEYVFDEEYDPNTIIKQDPEPGEEIVADEPVNIVISRGSEALTFEMPSLIGLTREEAEEKLEALGLSISVIEEEESIRFLQGQVVSQEPRAGLPVIDGSSVDLVVSSGLKNEEDAPVYTPGSRIPVPAGPSEQQITINVEDNNGEYTVYDETHNPGDRVYKRLHTVGSTVISIYIDGELIREEKIGF